MEGKIMTSLFQEKGLLLQSQKVEKLAKDVLDKLQNRYRVPVPESGNITWEEREFCMFRQVAWVKDGVFTLNRYELVTAPYETAMRETPVTLEIGTPDGKIKLTFPYGKILDWLKPTPQISLHVGTEPWTPLSDAEIQRGITHAIVSHALEQVGEHWLNTDISNSRCVRNGIVSAYGHLIAGTRPTPVSETIWDSDDPGMASWRETEGGFSLFFEPLGALFPFYEVVEKLGIAGPPSPQEKLPDYVARVLQ